MSAREFVDTHDWVCEQRVDGATGRVHTDYAFCGVGIDNGSSLLPPEALAACGSSSKFVRGLNGPAGFLLRSVDPSPAARAVPGADPSDRWTLFVMALDTDVRGWIPKSLTDGAMPDVILEYITNFRAAWRERTKHKEPLPPMPTTSRVQQQQRQTEGSDHNSTPRRSSVPLASPARFQYLRVLCPCSIDLQTQSVGFNLQSNMYEVRGDRNKATAHARRASVACGYCCAAAGSCLTSASVKSAPAAA